MVDFGVNGHKIIHALYSNFFKSLPVPTSCGFVYIIEIGQEMYIIVITDDDRINIFTKGASSRTSKIVWH